MTLSIPPMEPLRREEGWGRFESVGDRGRNGARAAARGDGAPHALPERNTPSTDGAQSSKGGIRDGTYRPSSRPRPSREKLGNESIVVMIYGRDVGRQSRLSRVWRAPERARAGAIKGEGGASGASSARSYFRSTLEATGTGIRGTCRPKARARGFTRCVNRALTAREPREHTDENRSIERNARVRRARPCARVPTVRFLSRRKKPDGKPEAPLAGRKARGGCAPLVFSGVEGARSIRAEPKYRSEVRVPFASRGRRSAWAVGRVRLWRERCSGRRSLGLSSKRMRTRLNLSCFWQLGRVSFEDPWVETGAYLEENRDVVA